MQIPVNKNIDTYKDDFYKGLTLRQTLTCAFALLAGTLSFCLFFYGFGLPQSVSLYLAFPVVFPIGAAGFLRIHGMELKVYFRRRRKAVKTPVYHYKPFMLYLKKEKGAGETVEKGRRNG